MKDKKIARNRSINAVIYRCFTYINREDKHRFVQKFQEQPHDQDQILHTFRELILGSFLGYNHFQVKNEYRIGNKTPDWSVLNDDLSVSCIIELVNFHIDKDTEEYINTELLDRGSAFYRTEKNEKRLYHSIQNKITTYNKIVESFNVPYVVAVFSDFKANLDTSEFRSCLFGDEFGLFYYTQI